MNEHQRVAIERHCRLGCETVHPRFRYMAGLFSVVLTINSGYE